MVLFCVWLSDALPSTRIRKPDSEPIQTVLPTSPNRSWKKSKPYSICTQDKICFLSLTVGFTRQFFLARPRVVFKVLFFGGAFHEHRGVPWEPGTSPSTPAKMTLVHRSHTQQNKRKQVSFSWKAPRNVPGGNRMLLLLCKGSTPGTQRKMTHPN